MGDNRKIRFAVVGCGKIARTHLKGITTTEEAELAAVCDVVAENAEAVAKQYGVRAYSSYEELLSQGDIDVVNICTPSGMHPEQTIRAAEAGKHIICEKPIAIRLDDATRMIAAARKHGVKLTSIFPRRMSPTSLFVKRLLEEGRLGKLSLCSGYVKFYRDQAYYDLAGWRGTWAQDGGGAMMNQGIHTVDLLQWLAGPVESLSGYATNVLRNIEVEDTAVVSLRFKSGALGSIEATTTAYKQPDHQIVLHGERGTIILTGDQITTLELTDEAIEIPEFAPFTVIPDGHRAQIRDMALAVIEGREPVVTGEDSLHSLEIILGAYESQRKSKEIRLDSLR
ncbi:MAG: gfo/Idh/MocA family oxidoreductase [Paenibacillus sp.]|jgi:predicted dehydrogenase|nr:gfo/Idh/MocA family oxidoreductase [Paenibacillus sp.]